MKICKDCLREFPETLEFFYFDKRPGRGFGSQCRPCFAIHRKKFRNTPKGRAASAAQMRRWTKNNPAKNAAFQRRWKKNNPTAAKAIAKRERAKHADAYRLYGRVNAAKRRRAPGSYTPADVKRQYDAQRGKCYYCRNAVGDQYHVDHVIPVTRGGTHDPSNLVIACPSCNRHKNDRMPHEWPDGGHLL